MINFISTTITIIVLTVIVSLLWEGIKLLTLILHKNIKRMFLKKEVKK